MPTALHQSNSPGQKAIQHLLTLIFILVVAKLISCIPVMNHLQLADTFTAAEIIWFCAKLTTLIIFFYFSRNNCRNPRSGWYSLISTHYRRAYYTVNYCVHQPRMTLATTPPFCLRDS